MLLKRGLLILESIVATSWQMLGAGELLCHHRNLTTEDWVLPTLLNLAKGRTLCPSQRVTHQAALGFTKINMSSHEQHQLNENFGIDQKPSWLTWSEQKGVET